jgi:hypothetical protein
MMAISILCTLVICLFHIDLGSRDEPGTHPESLRGRQPWKGKQQLGRAYLQP